MTTMLFDHCKRRPSSVQKQTFSYRRTLLAFINLLVLFPTITSFSSPIKTLLRLPSSSFFSRDVVSLRSTPSRPTSSSSSSSWSENLSTSAFEAVVQMAESVSSANRRSRRKGGIYGTADVFSTGLERSKNETGIQSGDEVIVRNALMNLEKDMQLLDNLAASRPQLSPLELTLLTASIVTATLSPFVFAYDITKVLAPSAAAFSASVGIGAEFTGKVAVADSKEVAASTIECAAQAEGLLANAERVKAIMPLCVGIGATATSFALLAPVLIDILKLSQNIQVVTEFYLLCPLVSVLSAAVAGLALQETRSFSARAISIGNRRFAKSGLVGRTWLSNTEQIERNSARISGRWRSFAFSVLPAPILGVIVPGGLPSKTIIVTALAACQSAYFLALGESTLARGMDAVALKARSAAVCDTYANQGMRSSAILPFTSALSSLCAAACAALVELPFIESLHSSIILQTTAISFFPILSSLFAAAASVSKARCEVDSEAATQAAETLALEYIDTDDDPIMRPFKGVMELLRSTFFGLGRTRFWKGVTKWVFFWKRE